MIRQGIRTPNNQGLITTALAPGGPDLCHILPNNRTAVIRKIMWYNNTGANITLIFGTVDNAVVPGWIPLFPTLLAINGVAGGEEEAFIPAIEFRNNRAALAAGWTGDIWVLASAINCLLVLEIEEFTP